MFRGRNTERVRTMGGVNAEMTLRVLDHKGAIMMYSM